MRERLRDRPWHQLLALPALIVQALVLVGSRRIWTDVIPMTSRGGVTSNVIAGRVYLGAMAFGAGAYWLSYAVGDASFLGGRGMRPPTEAERGCVAAMFRLGAAFVLYAFAFQIVRKYVFG